MQNFNYRFREIISDPINLKIPRHFLAGSKENDCIYMHNGLKVYADSYYDNFSDIFILNRGVHEPQEEYAFQVVLEKIGKVSPVMIEIGSYWAFYSMCFLNKFKEGKSYLIESGSIEIEKGKRNFGLNDLKGDFTKGRVSDLDIHLDDFFVEKEIKHIDILHTDIQGFEHQMLCGSHNILSNFLVDYLFISTHSFDLHRDIIKLLEYYDYHTISSVYPEESYCCDGIIVAQSPYTEKFKIDLGKRDSDLIISEEDLMKLWTAKNM